MILTGPEISKQRAADRITISPFNLRQINPNSYDFRLGSTIMGYRSKILDPGVDNPTWTKSLPETGFLLAPGKIYLGHTLEILGSNHFVPIIRAKSSIARLGLFIHVTADLIDIGSINQWTLQLHATQPVLVYPNMLIGQVTFWTTLGQVDLYKGKYQGSMGPVSSKSYLDFD